MAEVLNRREKILSESLPPKILTVDEIEQQLDDDGYLKLDDIPVASSETAGLVKIGDNVDVDENGVISVPEATQNTPGVIPLSAIPEGSYKPELIYTNDTAAAGAATFTFPEGKTLADYSFMLVCVFYDNSPGTADECVTSLLPVPLIITAGTEGIRTRINFDNTYYWDATITPTGITSPMGQYHTKRVYVF